MAQETQLQAILTEGGCWACVCFCKPRSSLSTRLVSAAAAAPTTARTFPPHARGRANESWWRSPCLQSRMEPVGSTGARDVPGETMIFRGQAVEVDGKHCPRHRWRWDPQGHTYPGVRVRHCVGQVGKAWWGLV